MTCQMLTNVIQDCSILVAVFIGFPIVIFVILQAAQAATWLICPTLKKNVELMYQNWGKFSHFTCSNCISQCFILYNLLNDFFK